MTFFILLLPLLVLVALFFTTFYGPIPDEPQGLKEAIVFMRVIFFVSILLTIFGSIS